MDAVSNEAIQYLSDSRKAWYVVHCTPIANIEYILEYGIQPRSKLSESNIPAITRDEIRKDELTHYTSLSVSYPNYKLMFSRKFEYGTEDFQDVVIEIGTKKLLKIAGDALFFPGNAAKSNAYPKSDLSRYKGIHAVDAMFSPDIHLSNDVTLDRAQENIPVHYTTDPQAEIMVSGIIPSELINRIYTSSEEQAEKIAQIVSDLNLSIPVKFDPTKFNRPHFWRAFDSNEPKGKLRIQL